MLLFGTAKAQSPALTDLPPCGADAGPILSSNAISFPGIGVQSEAEVGQSMIAAMKMDILDNGLVLDKELVFKGRYLFHDYTVTVPVGPVKKSGENLFDVPTYSFQYNGEARPRTGLGRPSVTLRLSDSNPADLVAVVDFGFHKDPIDIQGADFTLHKCVRAGPESYRRELLYSGVSKGTIEIEYREFLNDFARPAFSQTLHYDLSEGDEIGFRGARFKILKATNSGVQYILEKPLDGGEGGASAR